MTVNEDALRDLCERLGEDVSVDRRPDGALMLRTQFHFPDGDTIPIHLSEAPAGGIPRHCAVGSTRKAAEIEVESPRRRNTLAECGGQAG